MGEVWIQGLDGTSLIRAEEITSLEVVGTALEARTASREVVVLAEGTAEELADAAHSLMPGIDSLGEGSFTVAASRRPTEGIAWHADATDDSSGAAWAAMSSAIIDKEKWQRP